MAIDPKIDKLLNSRDDILIITKFPQFNVHVKGVPVIVPLSLSFHPNPNINPTHPWEISGKIVADLEDISVDIYNCDKNDPDNPTPDMNGFLHLTDPISSPIYSFFPYLPITVNLFDAKRNQHLFQDKTLSLDYSDYTNYDRVDYKNVEGDHGTLHLRYITYHAAVFADVKIVLKRKTQHNEGKVVPVVGSVIASWYYHLSDISLHSDHNDTECCCISLMNPNTHVVFGKSMDFVRPFLAMPAYSLVVIHVHLNVSEFGEINKIVVIPVADSGCFGETIQGPNGLLCDVKIGFCHEYDWFNETEINQVDGSETNNEDKEEKIKVYHDTEALSSYIVFSDNISRPLKREKLMEVFSILVIAKNENDIFNIRGKIKVNDLHHKNFYIFDKDKRNSDKVEGKGILCLEGPHDRSFVLSNNIELDLKAGGHYFCRGVVNWLDMMAKNIWLDSNLCSVIKGQHGYAVVHYMIYSAAVQAIVKLYLISSSHVKSFRSVSGKITAELSHHEYDTYFVREYFRSIVFSRTRESPAVLLPEEEESIPVPPEYVEGGISSSNNKSTKLLKGTGMRLPLSKSVVSVSDDESLVFDLNLSAIVEMEGIQQHEELVFSGRAECKIGRRICVVF